MKYLVLSFDYFNRKFHGLLLRVKSMQGLCYHFLNMYFLVKIQLLTFGLVLYLMGNSFRSKRKINISLPPLQKTTNLGHMQIWDTSKCPTNKLMYILSRMSDLQKLREPITENITQEKMNAIAVCFTNLSQFQEGVGEEDLSQNALEFIKLNKEENKEYSLYNQNI